MRQVFLLILLATALEGCKNSNDSKVGTEVNSAYAITDGNVVSNMVTEQTGAFGKKRDYKKFIDNFEFNLLENSTRLASIGNVFASYPKLKQPTQVGAGYDTTCATDDEGVKCWRNNRWVNSYFLSLKNPRQLVYDSGDTCVIDDEGLHCWSTSSEEPPRLKNPKQVSIGSHYFCAIDDEGIKCWGKDYYNLKPPLLKNPKQVSMADRYACAIDDEGVSCWGANPYPLGWSDTPKPNLKNPRQISVGNYFACAIDDEGVKCWGRTSGGQGKVPSLKNPRQISVGSYFACALDDEGVKCWGSLNDGTVKVPKLKNPRSVSVGFRQACAMDDEGLKCWGEGTSYRVPEFPPIKNFTQLVRGMNHICALDAGEVKCWDDKGGYVYAPRELNHVKQISAGFNHTCAIDDTNVECWGDGDAGQTQIQTNIKNPKQVLAGGNYSCVLDEEGVKCWGGSSIHNSAMYVPNLKNPKNITGGINGICALDDEGVKCWGRSSEYYSVYEYMNIYEKLKNPRQVSAGYYHTCALDDEGVKCWGKNDHGQLQVPSLKNPRQVSAEANFTCAIDSEGVKCWGDKKNEQVSKIIKKFPEYFGIIFSNVNLARAPILYDTINLIQDKFLLDDKLVLLSAMFLGPVVNSMDSVKATNELIPTYNEILQDLQNKLNVSGIDQIELTDDARKIAVTVLTSSMEVTFEFFTPQEKAELQDMVRLLGRATADTSDEVLKEVVLEFKNRHAIFNKLTRSPKTKFLVETMDNVCEWLEKIN
jgi:alpha-tubulin suppressor-like RCC1 family protein